MGIETFVSMRRKALREHKQSIVRTGRNGHKAKGRGLVLLKFTKGGVHLSYLTLDALKRRQDQMLTERHENGETLVHEISSYSPDSSIPVMVTDGITYQFSFGIRQ